MFYSQAHSTKTEILVNLLCVPGYRRGKFIEDTYGVGHSELWEVRKRVEKAMEPRPSGRPRTRSCGESAEPCAGCEEKDERIRALEERHTAERERGLRHLTLEAAVAPCSAPSIAALQLAAFGKAMSPDTIRRFIDKAGARALAVLNSFPWAQKLERLAADEMFAGKTPILVGVEPRSLAVPFLQRGPDRLANTWKKLLERFPSLRELASDQAPAILAAADLLGLLSQGDWFHAETILGKCLGALERQAFKRIAEEYDALKDLQKRKRLERPLKKAKKRHERAVEIAEKAIERFDQARMAKPLLDKAMSLFDQRAHWISFQESRGMIEEALAILQKVEAPYRKKVAHAYEPDRILNFKAGIEAPIEFALDLPNLDTGEFIEIAFATTQPCPSNPMDALLWSARRAQDQKLAAECPAWPNYRATLQEELQMPFRGSSPAEGQNSRLRVAQQVLKHLGPNLLALLALKHNATPFTSGKRKGRTPLQILGFETPPGCWRDWVLAA